VIDNFVTNAIRYTDQGSVTVWCEAHGQKALIGVSDTGIGIAAEALDHIFDDYVQLNNPERDRRKGLGLGLAIARRMAELLGSRIDVRSTVGAGSTFTIEAPLGAAAPAAAPATARAGPAEIAARQLCVLFVDDDEVIADAMAIVFRDAGIDLRLARDGEAAAALVAAGLRPDLIISDFRLPGGNGGEVIRRLRQALGASVPSVILTGDTGLQEVEKQADCVVLHKPIDPVSLIARARQLAAARPTAAADA
jgi:CheY-like chemotaxis protein